MVGVEPFEGSEFAAVGESGHAVDDGLDFGGAPLSEGGSGSVGACVPNREGQQDRELLGQSASEDEALEVKRDATRRSSPPRRQYRRRRARGGPASRSAGVLRL